MSKRIDLTGRTYGRLYVKELYGKNKRGDLLWLCDCDCGNKNIVVVGNNLKNNHTKSCGCLSIELTKKRNRRQNTWDLSGEYGVGYTTKGESFYFDLEDYDLIKGYCWYINESNYVRTRIGEHKQIYMHQLILPNYNEIDHIHGKETRNDNRKSNLRPCTHSENIMNAGLRGNNTSGVTGVSWSKQHQKWIAWITYKNNVIHLGLFDNFEDAVKVRKEAEDRYFGEFSYDNSQNICNSIY